MILPYGNITTRRGAPPVGRLRTLMLCALLAAFVGPAAAADLPDGDTWLRGSLSGTPVRWDGVTLGGHIGFTNMNTDFKDATTAAQLSSTTTNSFSFGGFLGYNVQWDDVILSIDATYTRPNSLATSSSSGSTSSSMKLIDYATVRGRAGYAIGQFLPYAFLGVAVGRMNHTTVEAGTITSNRENAIDGGVTAGLGIDVAFTPNMFVRGEWEFVAFGQVSGVRVSTNTARVGLGVRF